MKRQITDQDILTFIRQNRSEYPSDMTLMQATVRMLWPTGAPTNAGQRVVKLVLEESHPSMRI